ncbi:hypothetical protein [Paenibacillus xanthanilyticus]|uniref:Polymerase nucleotidyl transferase domain-containing protein n=1 Tax=Paenibacillus xanthanilyticus TaxID=1783531 RepID=A0ABV8K3I7_9BACL
MAVERWETAAADFLLAWTSRRDVIGAMLCGSYITGNPSRRSDLDIHLILSEDAESRERGNLVRGGLMIEYFLNPAQQIRAYFRQDFEAGSTMSMVQFATGRIVYDPSGVTNALKAEAKAWLAKEREGLTGAELELAKYAIWDDMDNVLDSYEQRRPDYSFVCQQAMMRLFQTYSRYLKLASTPHHQVLAYLKDPRYVGKYLAPPFPDEEFARKMVRLIQDNDPYRQVQEYEQLVQHVLRQMGGFDPNGWHLRTPLRL